MISLGVSNENEQAEIKIKMYYSSKCSSISELTGKNVNINLLTDKENEIIINN